MADTLEQRSPEWHEARKNRITASMVGAILGHNPYMTRDDAMRAMVRDSIGEPAEFTGNVATEYGTHHEPGALIEYKMETLHEVEQVGFITREDWAGCSPDGLIGERGGVELKCPYGLRRAQYPVQFKSLDEQPHYEAQVQFSLWVTGREWWSFFQWCPADTYHRVVKVDTDWQNENLPRLKQFYAEFLHERDNNADEYRQPKRRVIDTPEAHKMLAEWDEIGEQLERLAERKKDLLDAITSLGDGRSDLTVAGRKVTLVEREGAVSYAKVVKEHLPKLDLSKYRGKASTYWKVT